MMDCSSSPEYMEAIMGGGPKIETRSLPVNIEKYFNYKRITEVCTQLKPIKYIYIYI